MPEYRGPHNIQELPPWNAVRYRCLCGWEITQAWMETVVGGQREIASMLRAHQAGARVGPNRPGSIRQRQEGDRLYTDQVNEEGRWETVRVEILSQSHVTLAAIAAMEQRRLAENSNALAQILEAQNAAGQFAGLVPSYEQRPLRARVPVALFGCASCHRKLMGWGGKLCCWPVACFNCGRENPAVMTMESREFFVIFPDWVCCDGQPRINPHRRIVIEDA